MASADFQITFRGGQPLAGMVRFDPGSRLEGVIQIMPQENIRSRRVLVRVGWHTEGRGDRDAATVGELEMLKGNLMANTPVAQSFTLDLPREPWSFAGHYVNIVWDVIVIVDIPMSSNIEARQPFIMAPGR